MLAFQEAADDCLRAAVATIMDRPTSSVPHFVAEETPERDFWMALHEWLRGEGWTWGTEFPANFPYLVCGKSISGTTHAVVYQNGRFWHDPSGLGLDLAKPERFYVIERAATVLTNEAVADDRARRTQGVT